MKISPVILLALGQTNAKKQFSFAVEKCGLDILTENAPANVEYQCGKKSCKITGCEDPDDGGMPYILSSKVVTAKCFKDKQNDEFFWDSNNGKDFAECVRCDVAENDDPHMAKDHKCVMKNGQYTCYYMCRAGHTITSAAKEGKGRKTKVSCRCNKKKGTCAWYEKGAKGPVDPSEFICEDIPTEPPTTEKPTTGDPPTTEKPTTEKPTTEKPTTEKPTTEKPTTEKPTTEKPTTEKPTTKPANPDKIDKVLKAGCKRNNFMQGRIVGGVTVAKKSWPWVVYLSPVGKNTPNCGGTILSDTIVMTAAHCCSKTGEKMMDVHIGKQNRKNKNEGFTVTTTKTVRHPDFNNNSGAHDICVMKVPSITAAADAAGDKCNDCWGTACLPDAGPSMEHDCWVGGWGVLTHNGATPQTMKSIHINYYSKALANSITKYGKNEVAYPREFVAGVGDKDGNGLSDAGKDACDGDSGTPMICNINDEPILSGFNIWGNKCANEGFPGAYTNVFHYKDWILDTASNI